MAEQVKRLYRSRTNRMVGGVAAGLADFFGLDPTLVRLAFAIGVLAFGTGAGIYVIMWILVPEEPASV